MDENKKMIVFQVGKEEYAIPIEFVISIEKAEGITPIPHLPEYVKGISRVRGELIPVIDFEHILYDRRQAESDAARMIVLQTEELSLGASVSEAKEILDIPKEAIKELGLAAYQRTTYFSAVAALDSRLITIIDPLRLVQALDGIREIKEFMKERKEEAV
jgi:purine-binding chemotaxis protein CheW